MDLEAMIDDFITFFIAGQETTANTLAFCFLELKEHNPEQLCPELLIHVVLALEYFSFFLEINNCTNNSHDQ